MGDMSWVEEAKKLREQGLTYEEIGKIVGKVGGTVRVQLDPEAKKKSRAAISLWRKENPDRVKESQKKHLKLYPERVKATGDNYRANHKEEIRKRQSKYYYDNIEQERARSKKWNEENKDRVKETSRNRQIRKREELKEYNALYREKNKEKILAREAEYRKNNPEKQKAKDAARYAANPAKERARVAAYKEENSEQINARAREHRAEHPEISTLNNAKRRALKMSAEINDLTSAQWRDILESYDGHCCYCGRTDRPLTQDHIHPLKRHGNHTASNVAPACDKCNPSKGAKMLDEWIAVGGYPLHPPYKQINDKGDK
jgi:hypothetical protein